VQENLAASMAFYFLWSWNFSTLPRQMRKKLPVISKGLRERWEQFLQ
jgi:hypothetical protein